MMESVNSVPEASAPVPVVGGFPVTGGEPAVANATAAASGPTVTPAPKPPERSTPSLTYRDVEDGMGLLPAYARSLLKVELPVRVTLAETKQPLHRILELSPGTILQFNKPCEEPLTLEVDEQPVAFGEAVKVGDKFGLWITAMAMPGERFWVLGRNSFKERVK